MRPPTSAALATGALGAGALGAGALGAGALGAVLLGPHPAAPAGAPPTWRVEEADAAGARAHRRLRREVFVAEQGLFASAAAESDDVDDDPRAVVLVARAVGGADDGAVLGGVRLAPAVGAGARDVGWWAGSRLAVVPGARRGWAAGSTGIGSTGIGSAGGGGSGGGIGPSLVRAACARAEAEGALRFDACVQVAAAGMFARLGWVRVRDVVVAGAPHVLVRWPVGRVQALVEATKAPLGALLAPLTGGVPAGFVGDDGAPVPGSDLVAGCDAILPSLVEREPEWAGWCAVLANVNDLAAMGAAPVALLDAVGARDASFAARVLAGLHAAAKAYGVPVLGGHTQLGVPAALSVTALGRPPSGSGPVPAGGGRPGMDVTLTADTAGAWRPGHTGRQWDSTTSRSPEELRAVTATIPTTRPAAAKDVSMAGVVGTLGMLAEASGCGAVLDVAAVPRPERASAGDWLTCFPGSAWLSADAPGRAVAAPVVPGLVSAVCGRLVAGAGVELRWPDGETTTAVAGAATGLGPASGGGPASGSGATTGRARP